MPFRLHLVSVSFFIMHLIVFAARAEISVPVIGIHSTGVFGAHLIPPLEQERTCEQTFSSAEPYRSNSQKQDWQNTEKVITAANKQFVRRGWSLDFIKERLKLAELFKNRSEYFFLTGANSQHVRDGIVATLGITWARYSKSSLPFSNKSASSWWNQMKRSEFLPGEASLDAKPFPRPLTKKNDGIIMELRSWSVDKELLNNSERAQAFSGLLRQLLPEVLRKLQPYPELYDQPILYTYADEVSLRLYGAMGFINLSETPIQHEGSNWWILAISPKRLEAFVKRMRDVTFLSGLNQEIEISTPHGKLTMARGSMFVHDNPGWHSAGVRFLIGELNQETEVASGVWAAANTSVEWNTNGHLSSVHLAKPLQVLPGILADAGSTVFWDMNGTITQISRLAKKIEISPGIWSAKGASVEFQNGQISMISQLAEAANLGGGIVASRGARVEWNRIENYLRYVSELDQPLTLPDGLRVSAGGSVRWHKDLSKAKGIPLGDGSLEWVASQDYSVLHWSKVTKLAQDFELEPGIIAHAGASIEWRNFFTNRPFVSYP